MAHRERPAATIDNHEQAPVYIRSATHRAVKMALLAAGDRRDFSDPVEQLLDEWLCSRDRADQGELSLSHRVRRRIRGRLADDHRRRQRPRRPSWMELLELQAPFLSDENVRRQVEQISAGEIPAEPVLESVA